MAGLSFARLPMSAFGGKSDLPSTTPKSPLIANTGLLNGHTENHPLRSKPFKSWIRWQFYRETEKAPGSRALEDALSIPTLAIRPDLGDRCLVLILPTISKRSRTT